MVSFKIYTFIYVCVYIYILYIYIIYKYIYKHMREFIQFIYHLTK